MLLQTSWTQQIQKCVSVGQDQAVNMFSLSMQCTVDINYRSYIIDIILKIF